MKNKKTTSTKIVAVIPSDRELQIDLDSVGAKNIFRKRLAFFRIQCRAYRNFRSWHIASTIRKSPGGNWHATITLSQRMTLLERICAQVLLGDDPNRAMYNFFRYLNGSRFPILFYEKAKKGRL